MNKSLLILLLFLIAFLAATGIYLKMKTVQIEAPTVAHFPTVSGESLNGQKYTFPADFGSRNVLILFAYEEDQAEQLRSWVKGLDLLNSEIAWFETPVVSTPLKLGSFIIDRGMRNGIPDPRIRDRVVTLYTNQENFSKSLGIPFDPKGAYALVLKPSGHPIGYVSGEFDQEKAKTITEMLNHP